LPINFKKLKTRFEWLKLKSKRSRMLSLLRSRRNSRMILTTSKLKLSFKEKSLSKTMRSRSVTNSVNSRRNLRMLVLTRTSRRFSQTISQHKQMLRDSLRKIMPKQMPNLKLISRQDELEERILLSSKRLKNSTSLKKKLQLRPLKTNKIVRS